jgi:hypothetical protein
MSDARARRDPETPAEWRAAVDAARFALGLDSCRQYGLIEWGGEIDADRCLEILFAGRLRGFEPKDAAAVIDHLMVQARKEKCP